MYIQSPLTCVQVNTAVTVSGVLESDERLDSVVLQVVRQLRKSTPKMLLDCSAFSYATDV
jgi:hypothetical protein